MNLNKINVPELVISLLRDKMALKYELKQKDFIISKLKNKLNKYEGVN